MQKQDRIAPSRVIKNPYHYSVETPKVHVSARKLLHGALDSADVGYSWARPSRFLPEQVQAMTSCQAWYPGIFRQMTTCTSGICLEFETDCSFITIDVRADEFPRASRDVFSDMFEDVPAPRDAFGIEIDGKLVRTALPEVSDKGSVLKIDIAALVQGSEEQASEPLQLLPILDQAHQLRIWLPCLRGCELGDVYGEGSYIRAVPQRTQMLVLGDSVAQGFCADAASDTWPCLVAREWGLELVNQSVGAQVFQYSSLAGLSELERDLNPELVLVALGANYRWEPCLARVVERDILNYLQGVDALWPQAQLVVIIPDVSSHEPVAKSCYKQVPSFIKKIALDIRAKRVAEGRPALFISYTPVFAHELMADDMGHLTTEGNQAFASFVLRELQKLECHCLAQFGKYGQCGSCAVEEPEPEAEAASDDTAMDELAVENNIDDAEEREEVEPLQVARLMRLVDGGKAFN